MNKFVSKYLTLIVVVIMLVALPVILYLVRQQQIFKPKAAGEAVTLKFSPPSATKQLGEALDVIVQVDTQTNDVSFVDLNLTFDKDKLQMNSFTPSNIFNTIVTNGSPDNITGTFHYVAGNNSISQITGGTVNIGVIHFTARSLGVAQVRLVGKEVTVRTTPPTDVVVNPANGTYTIVAQSQPTATTVPTAVPTIVPTLTPTVNGVQPSFNLSPNIATKQVGDSLDVQFLMNTGTSGTLNNMHSSDVSFIDLNFTFDKDKLQMNSFTPSNIFNTIVVNGPPNNTTGTFRYAAGNNSTSQVTGDNVNLGTVHFTAKAVGTARATLSGAEVTIRENPPRDVNSIAGAGNYTIIPGGGNVTPSPTSVPVSPTTIPTSVPTTTSAPTSVPTAIPTPTNGTVAFRYAENINELLASDWKAYTADPFVINHKFADTKPGLKFIFVQFQDRFGKISEPQSKSIELVIDPEITGCGVEMVKAQAIYTINGTNLGSLKGTVTEGANTLTVISWSDTKVVVKNPDLKAMSPDFRSNIILTRPDKSFTKAVCGNVANSLLSLGAKLFCPQVNPHPLTKVAITIAEATTSGQVFKSLVNIDEEGLITSPLPALKPNAAYKLGIKAQKSVRQVVEFIAEYGATNITSFSERGKRLPLGDIFPLDGGDGAINTLDKSELNREWIVSEAPESERRGDLNTDSRVNSIDWACMRYDFNKEDEPDPKPGPLKNPSLLNNLQLQTTSASETGTMILEQ